MSQAGASRMPGGDGAAVVRHLDATVGFVPRECFSSARRGLETLLGTLGPGTRVVCVDAGSPRSIGRFFEKMAGEHDLALLRTERFMTPNEARNAVLPFVDTTYVAFVDYDTETTAGWLEGLVGCAISTGASIVAPVFYQRDGRRVRLHMAGGVNHLDVSPGRRHLRERSWHELPVSTSPYRTENVDFHCVVIRRDVFDVLGPLDEQLSSLRDHSDLCLALRQRGGSVYVEPSVEAVYARLRRFRHADRQFWIVRWSDVRNRESLERFGAKWGVASDDPSFDANMEWARAHRRYCYRPWISVAARVSDRVKSSLADRIDPWFQRAALARAAAATSRSGSPRLVHRPSWLSTGAPRA